MQSDDAADVPWELLTALRCWQVGIWVLSVHLDDVVAVVQICLGILVCKFIAEEFRQRLHLDLVDGLEIKPLGTAWNDEGLLLILLFNLYQQLFLCILVGLGLKPTLNFHILPDIILARHILVHLDILIIWFPDAVFHVQVLSILVGNFLGALNLSISLIGRAVDLSRLDLVLRGLDNNIVAVVIS